jgi:hypothetical protein
MTQPMATPARRPRKPAPSIQDAPVSARHRIADDGESYEDQDSRRVRGRSERQGTLELEHENPGAAPTTSIHARINEGCVEFRVAGKNEPVTFDELAAACAQQLPGVVLERRTKWLQYTFDLWSHAGHCLYSIPIASMPAPAPAPAARKPRRHPSDLAAHHPRG